jgi:hypothetical protein
MPEYDDRVLAVIGLLVLGPATPDQIGERLDYPDELVVEVIKQLVTTERIIPLKRNRYALVLR